MPIHARTVGSNVVYYQGSNRQRVVDAIGPDVVKYDNDFMGPVASTDTPFGFSVTLVEAGAGETTLARTDGVGGLLLITTDAAEDDGANLQVTNEAFKLTTSQRLVYFGARLKLSEATQSDILVGLCITDTTLLGGMTDGVYFEKLDGGATWSCTTEKNSTETQTDSIATLVADTYVILEFMFEGAKVNFYVDGVLKATHTTNIVDDEELTPSIHFLTGAAAAITCTIDWIRAVMIGR